MPQSQVFFEWIGSDALYADSLCQGESNASGRARCWCNPYMQASGGIRPPCNSSTMDGQSSQAAQLKSYHAQAADFHHAEKRQVQVSQNSFPQTCFFPSCSLHVSQISHCRCSAFVEQTMSEFEMQPLIAQNRHHDAMQRILRGGFF